MVNLKLPAALLENRIQVSAVQIQFNWHLIIFSLLCHSSQANFTKTQEETHKTAGATAIDGIIALISGKKVARWPVDHWTRNCHVRTYNVAAVALIICSSHCTVFCPFEATDLVTFFFFFFWSQIIKIKPLRISARKKVMAGRRMTRRRLKMTTVA